jgi:ribonuclease J
MKQSHKTGLRRSSTNNRGAAMRAQQRTNNDADRTIQQYAPLQSKPTANASIVKDLQNKLKVTFLGGLEDVGEKNMAVIEYGNEAIILDCGNALGIDLPGINYTINDTVYLETIKHKIKGYVITHGHLDHMGGLRHTVPQYPAPIYGSRYTNGIIEQAFESLLVDTGKKYTPTLVTADLDTHEKLKIGVFTVEFIRVTHALPDAAAVCIDTPVGKVIATGDFRLDPEPLDKMPTDVTRLKELGDEGVLLLLSDSSYADIEGRVPTESTLQQSFYDIISNATGRIFVAAFSSNMNRAQMIINAAVAAGRQVALDGRGMLTYAEIAVRQGVIKIPKGTVVPIEQAASIAPDKLLVMCTGGQGEPNAALQRMSQGEHRYVNLKAGDTVVISSSPIPGNEVSYDALSNRLKRRGVHLFRHVTYQIDGCGPLHVSGHARRDELRDMLNLVHPKFFIPVHGGTLRRSYHAELAVEQGIPRKNVLLLENGASIHLTSTKLQRGESVSTGSLLVDQNASVVSSLVVKDRLMLSEMGILSVVLTIDKTSGKLVDTPDVISRGFIVVNENRDLMDQIRSELQRSVAQRFKRVSLDQFKAEVRDHISNVLYTQTGSAPLVIPVVTAIGTRHSTPVDKSNNDISGEQQKFAEMRANLLS